MNQTQIKHLMNLPCTNPGNAERLHALIGGDWKYEESDLLQQWLDERTEPSLGFLKFSKALEDFNNWLSKNGSHGWQRKSFTEAMQLHGKMKIRRATGFGYDNLCLR